jgi:formylglycine-generating enzyme required for sulfatase activity
VEEGEQDTIDGQAQYEAVMGTNPSHFKGEMRPVETVSWENAVTFCGVMKLETGSEVRLPTEAEWEQAAAGTAIEGNFADDGVLHPQSAAGDTGLCQLFGDVWEWTASDFAPYPGFRAPEGALGEYNGKFMVNQRVLRGGSCATPKQQMRTTYRTFFYPHQRWQMMGLRLAKDDA